MKKLNLVTLIYISVPTFLFLILWLNPWFACLSAFSLIVSLLIANKYLDKSDSEVLTNGEFKNSIITSFGIALIVCLCSEFGIFNYESYDYTAHNIKFNILATQSLPLYDEERDIYMCYYLGHYLVPSFLGKYTSIAFIKFYFFIWSYIGIGLSFTWLQIKLGNISILRKILICFSLLIGAYVCIVFPLIGSFFSQLKFIKNNDFELNNDFLIVQIPILTRNLSESPQHAVPAILGACYLLAIFKFRSYFLSLVYFLLGTLFITPFAAVGMVFFLLFSFVSNFLKYGKEFFIRSLQFTILLLAAYGPVVLFLASSEATDMESNKAIWNSGTPYWFVYYLFYLICSYGIWFVFFGREIFKLDKAAVLIACILLCVMPLFQMGHYNDLNMRSGIVPQMILGAGVVWVIICNWKLFFKDYLFTIGVVFWALNSLSPLKFYYDRFFVLKGKESSIENPGLERFGKSYYDFMEIAYPADSEEAVKQYSLKKESWFEMYMLKKK